MLAFGAGLMIVMLGTRSCAEQEGGATSRPADSAESKPATTSTRPATKPSTRPSTKPATQPAGGTAVLDKPKPDDTKPDKTKTRWNTEQGDPDRGHLSIGSTDPGSGYTFEVQFNTSGASIHTVKLSKHYATVADKRFADENGYEKYSRALAEGTNKDLLGPCSVLNPVSHDGVIYYSLATRRVEAIFPDGKPAAYSHDPQLLSRKADRKRRKWRGWKPLPADEAKALGLDSTDDMQRFSFYWILLRKDPDDAEFRKALRLIKTYSVRKNDYTIYVSLRVENLWGGAKPLAVSIDQGGPTGVPREDARTDMRKVAYGEYDTADEQVAVTAEKRKDKINEVNLGSPETVGNSFKRMLWIGQSNKFFACLLYLKPDQSLPPDQREDLWAASWRADFYYQDAKENATSPTQITGLRFSRIPVESGKPRTIDFELFAGPKRIDMFEDADDKYYRESYKILAYKDTIDLSSCFCASDWLSLKVVGFLGGLAENVTFGNYGLAIFLLVLIVRLLLHPLTKKGQVTMSKMKKLQPMMKELEKKYADDKDAMNRERIKLFRQHGATPFLGCLPMLLQMPILIALWRGISATTDLRHAAFLPVWIVDLSAPDRLFSFGTDLPFIGEYLHLMPLLLGAAMYWQMKLSPQSQTPSTPEQAKQQKMMQLMFPIMMPAMFYHMASGLTLYFLASTFFGAVEQHYIRKHIEAKEALQAATETTVRMPGKGPRGSRPKKPKGPMWHKRG